jgi:hypothetical protein
LKSSMKAIVQGLGIWILGKAPLQCLLNERLNVRICADSS